MFRSHDLHVAVVNTGDIQFSKKAAFIDAKRLMKETV
jgi:hypothetical protein